MEEKDITKNNGPENTSQAKKVDNRNDSAIQPNTKKYETDGINNTLGNKSKKDGLHIEDSNQNRSTNEGTKVTGRDTVLKRFHKLSQENHLQTKTRKRPVDNVFTIIVISYTILILLLGFLVYNDITKRLNRLENRISNIESRITKKSKVTLDDIEIYDDQ